MAMKLLSIQQLDTDYTEYGINNALLIDNTGVWRNKEVVHT